MINLLVVDQYPIAIAGIRRVLDGYVDIKIIAETQTTSAAYDKLRETPDINTMILDLDMPASESAFDFLTRVVTRYQNLNILVFTALSERQYALQSVKQGAAGFISKTADTASIVNALRTVSLGRRYFSPAMTEIMSNALSGRQVKEPHEDLSEREFQVFIKLAKGEASGDIATSLALSVKTVSTYRTRLMEKLSLNTNSELTYYALKHGLIT
jgi:two-component system invasion response regulator UvrY